MIFSKNKTRPLVPRKGAIRHHATYNSRRHPASYKPARRQEAPSWKTFKTQKRRDVGRGSPRLYSTGRRRPIVSVRTPRLVVSEVRLVLLKLAYRVLFLLLAAGIIYFLFFSEWLQINKIMVEGNKTIDKKLILDAVEPYLHRKVFFIFPSNNFFSFPLTGLKTKFPLISSGSVR